MLTYSDIGTDRLSSVPLPLKGGTRIEIRHPPSRLAAHVLECSRMAPEEGRLAVMWPPSRSEMTDVVNPVKSRGKTAKRGHV